MIWPGRLARPVAYRRITPFRTSCGPPNPVAGAGCGGHDRVCPALSGRPPCRWSRCRSTIIVFQQAVHRYSEVAASRPYEIPLAPLQRLRQVAVSPIRTRSLERLEKPTACPRITPFRTSYGFPDPAVDVACGAFGQPVRHCRGHDPDGRAAGDAHTSIECGDYQ